MAGDKINKRKAVFLDRDGVLLIPIVRNGIPRPPYTLKEFEEEGGRMPYVIEVLEELNKAGFLLILISNQPDISYGNISKSDWEQIHNSISDLPLDDSFICFHGRAENCQCKKPTPGLIIEAIKKWNIEIGESYIVGDTQVDVDLAKNVGCRIILIDAPYNKDIKPDFRVKDFLELTTIFKL